MKLSKTINSIAAVSLCLASLNSFAVTWKLSHNQANTHPVHKAMEFFAEKVKGYTNGDVRIKIYPNATLGNERESIESLKSGALQLVKVSSATLGSFDNSFNLLSLPYVFNSRDAYYETLTGPVGEKILQSPKSKGFVGIAYYDAGARSFYASKPINTPADLAGMKIRVMGSPTTAVEMMNLLGGVPTPMAQGEVYTALQQGVIDGAENNPVVFNDMRHFEVAKTLTLDEHAMIPDVLIISNAAMEKLSPADQASVKKAAMESMIYMKDSLWPAAEKASFEGAKKAGSNIVTVDKTPFREKVMPMYDDFKTKNPDLAKDLDTVLSYK